MRMVTFYQLRLARFKPGAYFVLSFSQFNLEYVIAVSN